MVTPFERCLILLITTPLLIIFAFSCEAAPTAKQALNVLDVHNLDNSGGQVFAYGVYALAAARLSQTKRAKIAANWLVKDAKKPQGFGWGRNEAWDAFKSLQDNTMNPPETIYGVTVGTAVKGLLDVYTVTGKRKYLNTALKALAYYRQFFLKGNFFAYSDSGFDAHEVYNVSAHLAGQYARVGAACDIADYRRIARKAVRRLNKAKLHDHWPYSALSPAIDDAGHTAITVMGIDEARKHVRVKMSMRAARRYMKKFVVRGTVRSWPQGHAKAADPAPLGSYMAVTAILGKRSLLKGLRTYRIGRHAYAAKPGGVEINPTGQVWVALGISMLKDKRFTGFRC